MGLASINIKFSADLTGFSSEMQNSIRRIGALGKELQNTGRNLSTFVSLPLVAAGAAAVKFASDYNESLNKVDVAFGTSANSVKDFAKTSLESFGIAEGTALDMAATFGDMATALGLPVDKAGAMSKSLVGLAGDLASFKNISIDIANTALSGIFTGETESLKKLGIVMTEANLGAFALSQGITKQVKDMSQAEKVGLRYNYILSVTKNAQGDFARTGSGAANQMRIFQESLKQVGQQLGAVILPAFTKMITYVNGAIKGFSGLSDGTKTTIVVLAGIAAAIGPVLTGMGSLLTFVPGLISKVNALKTAFGGLTTIITANPYTALAIAVAAVAAGIFLWYSNTQKTVTAQESLNQAVAQGNKAAATEVGALDRLYTSATNVKLSIDERKSAIRSLQEQYPAYFKNIDTENIKNGQAAGIYKELRDAIFDKARATAIESELTKRAQERLEKEVQLKQNIADTEQDIQNKRKGAAVIVLQEASAMEKTKAVTITKNEAVRQSLILLQRQKDALAKFTEDSKSSDQILVDSKAQYDAKTKKLADNEAQRQKDLIALNGLQASSVDALKVGTISYYESLISAAQKSQKEVVLNSVAWGNLQQQIDGYQKKIDAIEGKGSIKLPKPEIPTLGDAESPESPAFSLQDLKGQKAYFEALREQFATTSDQYSVLSENINNTQLKIEAIEGVEDVKVGIESLGETQSRLAEIGVAVGETVAGAFSSLSLSIVESLGLAKTGFEGFIAGLVQTITKLIAMMLASAISQSIAGATATGTATGPAAVFTTPAFIATAVGGVLAAFAAIPKFATGGIVGGSSLYGDKILARVNSQEMIANTDQQRKIWSLMNNDGGGTTVVLQGDWSVRGDQIDLILSRYQNNKNRKG
jgi:hypothetical protein